MVHPSAFLFPILLANQSPKFLRHDRGEDVLSPGSPKRLEPEISYPSGLKFQDEGVELRRNRQPKPLLVPKMVLAGYFSITTVNRGTYLGVPSSGRNTSQATGVVRRTLRVLSARLSDSTSWEEEV